MIDWAKTKLVGLTKAHSGLKATACKPHCESVYMMIASGRFSDLAHGCPAKLTAPHYDRILEQAAALQIENESGARLIYFTANRW